MRRDAMSKFVGDLVAATKRKRAPLKWDRRGDAISTTFRGLDVRVYFFPDDTSDIDMRGINDRYEIHVSKGWSSTSENKVSTEDGASFVWHQVTRLLDAQAKAEWERKMKRDRKLEADRARRSRREANQKITSFLKGSR